MELHCSQTVDIDSIYIFSLSTLWNYTALKLTTLEGYCQHCLSTLWNYTALKQIPILLAFIIRLSTLWNYTALKRAATAGDCGAV